MCDRIRFETSDAFCDAGECVHCGEPIGDNVVFYGGAPFHRDCYADWQREYSDYLAQLGDRQDLRCPSCHGVGGPCRDCRGGSGLRGMPRLADRLRRWWHRAGHILACDAIDAFFPRLFPDGLPNWLTNPRSK